MRDLEIPQLNLEFINFYRSIKTTSRELVEVVIDEDLPKIFRVANIALLSKQNDYGYHDGLFENFTILTETLWMTGAADVACRVWNKVSIFVNAFEKNNFRIHKGTLYYFWSIPLLLTERLESGVLALHKAVEEDKRTDPEGWENRPAHLALSLSERPGPYMKELIIDPQVAYLKELFGFYATKVGNGHTFEQFRIKFIENVAISNELKYYFTWSTLKMQYTKRLDSQGLGDSTIGPLIFSASIRSLILVIENMLETKYGPHKLSENCKKLSKSLNLASFDPIKNNSDCNSDFVVWMEGLINKGLLEDVSIVHGLRNEVSHSLKNYASLWKNQDTVASSVYNVLFSIILLA